MRRLIVLALMLCAGAAAAATAHRFTATLAGKQETPPNQSRATGTATFSTTGKSLTYTVRVSGLDSVTAAHIHLGVAGVAGPPVVTLTVPTSNGRTRVLTLHGTVHATSLQGPYAGLSIADLAKAMRAESTYVNVHTAGHPDGEIRGQIHAAKSGKRHA
jgi:hypothetical protein